MNAVLSYLRRKSTSSSIIQGTEHHNKTETFISRIRNLFFLLSSLCRRSQWKLDLLTEIKFKAQSFRGSERILVKYFLAWLVLLFVHKFSYAGLSFMKRSITWTFQIQRMRFYIAGIEGGFERRGPNPHRCHKLK